MQLPEHSDAAITQAEGEASSSDMMTEKEDFICDTCRKIEYQELLQNPRSTSVYDDLDWKSPHIMRYTKNCAVCEMLFTGFLYDMSSTSRLRSETFPIRYSWEGEYDPAVQNSTKLMVLDGNHVLTKNDVFLIPTSARADSSSQPKPVQQTWDLATAQSWLDVCIQCHTSLCRQESLLVPGMNLIDCEDMVLVKADASSQWIALSYVWGANYQATSSEANVSFREGSRMPQNLPRTVQDAVTVTKQLGHRYLWVDEYCIDQRDEVHKHDQIDRMDQIYRGANLTIVAAAGENKNYGLPGIGGTKRKGPKAININGVIIFSNGPEPDKETRLSKWFQRAWTYQEGYLSKRLMVFTDHQISFHCKTMYCMEGFGKVVPSEYDSVQFEATSKLFDEVEVSSAFDIISPIYDPSVPRGLSDWDYFCQMVITYTGRQLTNEADALNAFRGVMHDMRRSRPPAYTLSGLPFFAPTGQQNGSCLEDLVAYALMWLRIKEYKDFPIDRGLQRRSMFPSWTWIGWQGQVRYARSKYLGTMRRCYVRQLQLESFTGEVVELSALWESASAETIQCALDIVEVVCFAVPTIPSESITGSDYGDETPECWESELFRIFGSKPVSDEPDADFYKLMENVRTGKWSCLLLSCTKNKDLTIGNVLVVQWHADKVKAERIGAFGFEWVDPDAQHDLLQWRSVRLI